MASLDPAVFQALRYQTLRSANSNRQNAEERSRLPPIKALKPYLRSIWLFTFSDLKTIVGPESAFGILHAFCAEVFGIEHSNSGWYITQRIPLVVFWTWINLLPFAINNQRQPAAVLEDSINKPWRPMPLKLISPREAKHMMLAFYAVAFGTSVILGGVRQHVALIALGYLYNDCGGADRSCISRNLINGIGFICFGSGAMEVALDAPLPLHSSLMGWFGLISLMVFTTVHTQDTYDQIGDRSRGRWTVPLSIGDLPSRWTIAVAMVFWTLYCPMFWQLPYLYCAVTVMLGIIVALRALTKRSIEEDKRTFRLWNLWMVTVYSTPLLKLVST